MKIIDANRYEFFKVTESDSKDFNVGDICMRMCDTYGDDLYFNFNQDELYSYYDVRNKQIYGVYIKAKVI